MGKVNDERGHGGHGGHGTQGAGAWMEQHLGGVIAPFGKRLEVFFEHTMFLFVNGLMQKLGIIFLAIMTPVILLELVVHTVRF